MSKSFDRATNPDDGSRRRLISKIHSSEKYFTKKEKHKKQISDYIDNLVKEEFSLDSVPEPPADVKEYLQDMENLMPTKEEIRETVERIWKNKKT